MAYKILKNNVGVDITVRLITRVGDEPGNIGEKIDVDVPKGGTVTQQYSGPYLDGIRIESETNGHQTFKRQMVTVRGSAWDDTLNTNDTLTISTSTNMSVAGSNS